MPYHQYKTQGQQIAGEFSFLSHPWHLRWIQNFTTGITVTPCGELLEMVQYGYHPQTPLTIDNPNTNNPSVNDFMNRHALARSSASQALKDTASTMKKYADRRRKDLKEFKEGQLVWLNLRNIKTRRPAKKLNMRWTGPFPVVKKINPVAYQIKLPLSWRVHPVFHVSLLKPAHINESLHPTTPDDTLQPPPDIIDVKKNMELTPF